MKLSFTAAVLSAVGLAFNATEVNEVQSNREIDPAKFQMKWFMNMKDHFNKKDTSTYRQRYWESDQYWDTIGPIFLYLCGNERCGVPNENMAPFEIGKEFNAKFMVLEHRFYGDSQPTTDWSTRSLALLSYQQALADVAVFVDKMKTTPDQKVVVIGGGYAGGLAAWFRSRFPQHATAAWASSAMVQPMKNFWGYDAQVYKSTELSGAWCPKLVEQATYFVMTEARDRLSGIPNFV